MVVSRGRKAEHKLNLIGETNRYRNNSIDYENLPGKKDNKNKCLKDF